MGFHTIISEFRSKLASPQSQARITQTDIDQFYSKLNNLRFLFFKSYYKKYIENLNRLRPDPKDTAPDWTLLNVALAENEWKPTTPFRIFIHRIKYDYLLTSRFFVAHQKKQNKKKLNSPKKEEQIKTKPASEKEWIRVPMPGIRRKPGQH